MLTAQKIAFRKYYTTKYALIKKKLWWYTPNGQMKLPRQSISSHKQLPGTMSEAEIKEINEDADLLLI